jgi:hypothetical protein
MNDVTAIGIAAAFVIGLSQMKPVRNEGKLSDIMATDQHSKGVEPRGVSTEPPLASISGIRTRNALSSCGMPQGVGISTRLLPPKDAAKFDDSEFMAVDPNDLVAKNFLTATARLGNPTNTSNRIRNHQLRSDPLVERSITVKNTPWQVSPHTTHDIERPFELQTLNQQTSNSGTKGGGRS